ncbi:MAG: hypothetical protein JO066_14570 [Verrucomicrobia bacterium]|nr:hypothetical protein [Verrucomicrobiota bacterium]MBV9300187.1 hypothetical protein [Verrucomicrobiota bacterium]
MFHPQSYFATTELIHRVLQEAFGETRTSLPHALITFSFDLFHGKTPEFQPCDTAFHDFEHTMQATAAVVDLLAAHRRNPFMTSLKQRDWELAIAASILHDTGYLKRRNDIDGSGAKYSAIHVGRSCFHAWDLLPSFGFTGDELRQIQNAICATAISVCMDELPFRDPREWLIGALVGTGDMLGQMAAEDYPERLAGLYLEFREAAAFSRLQKASFAVHKSLLDLLRGTEKFYSGYVTRMLEQEWKGVYRILDDSHGRNRYIDRIRTNITRVNLMACSLASGHREVVARRFLAE